MLVQAPAFCVTGQIHWIPNDHLSVAGVAVSAPPFSDGLQRGLMTLSQFHFLASNILDCQSFFFNKSEAHSWISVWLHTEISLKLVIYAFMSSQQLYGYLLL